MGDMGGGTFFEKKNLGGYTQKFFKISWGKISPQKFWETLGGAGFPRGERNLGGKKVLFSPFTKGGVARESFL